MLTPPRAQGKRRIAAGTAHICVKALPSRVAPGSEFPCRFRLPSAAMPHAVELQNVTKRGFRHTRDVYDGPRNNSPLLYSDDRDTQFGRMYWVRVRKTFGS